MARFQFDEFEFDCSTRMLTHKEIEGKLQAQPALARLPGSVAGDTTYSSVADLSKALQRAAAAHD